MKIDKIELGETLNLGFRGRTNTVIVESNQVASLGPGEFRSIYFNQSSGKLLFLGFDFQLKTSVSFAGLTVKCLLLFRSIDFKINLDIKRRRFTR